MLSSIIVFTNRLSYIETLEKLWGKKQLHPLPFLFPLKELYTALLDAFQMAQHYFSTRDDTCKFISFSFSKEAFLGVRPEVIMSALMLSCDGALTNSCALLLEGD